jgi:hypothetical protein
MTTQAFLQSAADHAAKAGVFGPVSVRDGQVICHAAASAAPASYRLFVENGTPWVSLVMADRWLSESIETDLLHTGDKVADLVEEELVELGLPPQQLKVEHFRSDDLLFTFRSPLPVDPASPEGPGLAAKYLLAYEACFRNLGDMNAGPED